TEPTAAASAAARIATPCTTRPRARPSACPYEAQRVIAAAEANAMRIDPSKRWRKVEARLAREKDPRLRRNLETVLAHMKAEAAPDLDALMATVADHASYHAFGAPDPLYSPQGKEAVRGFYTAFIASGA